MFQLYIADILIIAFILLATVIFKTVECTHIGMIIMSVAFYYAVWSPDYGANAHFTIGTMLQLSKPFEQQHVSTYTCNEGQMCTEP